MSKSIQSLCIPVLESDNNTCDAVSTTVWYMYIAKGKVWWCANHTVVLTLSLSLFFVPIVSQNSCMFACGECGRINSQIMLFSLCSSLLPGTRGWPATCVGHELPLSIWQMSLAVVLLLGSWTAQMSKTAFSVAQTTSRSISVCITVSQYVSMYHRMWTVYGLWRTLMFCWCYFDSQLQHNCRNVHIMTASYLVFHQISAWTLPVDAVDDARKLLITCECMTSATSRFWEAAEPFSFFLGFSSISRWMSTISCSSCSFSAYCCSMPYLHGQVADHLLVSGIQQNLRNL